MKHLNVFLACLLACLVVSPAAAQSSIQVSDVRVASQFGERVTFQGRVSEAASITEGFLLFRADGDENTRVYPLVIQPDGAFSYEFDPRNAGLRSFALVRFFFRFTLVSGSTFDSPNYFFRYDDNRFPWQQLESGSFVIHWYAGDVAFGQAAEDSARKSLARLGEFLPIRLEKSIEIYVYSSGPDLQSALELGGQSWVAGHASPDLGVVLVSIPPGPEQGLGMDRLIPHELAHILIYQLTGERYNLLPTWLREGIASAAELSPSPDYDRALTLATENGSLLPMADLCGSFPPDASSRFLAYAQSASFTRYLLDEYGSSGLLNLVSAYADGLGCEQGSQRAFGQPLTQVERAWRANVLGENRAALALENLAGYLTLFFLILAAPAWRAFSRKKLQDEPAKK
jgi:hypothetical protein